MNDQQKRKYELEAERNLRRSCEDMAQQEIERLKATHAEALKAKDEQHADALVDAGLTEASARAELVFRLAGVKETCCTLRAQLAEKRFDRAQVLRTLREMRSTLRAAECDQNVDEADDEIRDLRAQLAAVQSAASDVRDWLLSFSMPPTAMVQEKQYAIAKLDAAPTLPGVTLDDLLRDSVDCSRRLRPRDGLALVLRTLAAQLVDAWDSADAVEPQRVCDTHGPAVVVEALARAYGCSTMLTRGDGRRALGDSDDTL